ncbi:hypothetical protein XccvBFoX1_gp07c [Xanthomonas phage FoX1]|uniref:Uncharacterized protein n=1 Tax=Xanthomonas phage FoX1 TaxID=2723897 RepID=A0A858NPZ8_9CAUD|nr:hypothetical protein KNU93_gp07 [Xanthomonas phage FoX1]QJB21746.1 hypothetical protein XccvBFoX1_gp07c [Xanthomonas phage FoX1]
MGVGHLCSGFCRLRSSGNSIIGGLAVCLALRRILAIHIIGFCQRGGSSGGGFIRDQNQCIDFRFGQRGADCGSDGRCRIRFSIDHGKLRIGRQAIGGRCRDGLATANEVCGLTGRNFDDSGRRNNFTTNDDGRNQLQKDRLMHDSNSLVVGRGRRNGPILAD